MITKLLGLVVLGDGLANMIWFHVHGEEKRLHNKYQLGRAIRSLIGTILVLL